MIESDKIIKFFKDKFGGSVNISIEGISKGRDVKGYGYGEPIIVNVSYNDKIEKYVVNTLREDRFGHEYISDRAGEILWSFRAFNNLPKHVKAVDVGYISLDGELRSIHNFNEFFLITKYMEGKLYKDFLFELSSRKLRDEDLNMVDKLAKYLSEIHSTKVDADPWLYNRRIRDLIGHGECIMGIIDSYLWSGKEVVERDYLKDLEHKAVEWRWRLRDYMHRLSVVHGDFHPWNIIWRGDDFHLLDRSRGEFGEPADDIAALTINYIFISLLTYGEFKEPYKNLYEYFFDRYLSYTGDHELLKVIQPFYAWRGLVVANPIWYPNLQHNVRRKIFNFISHVLDLNEFDYSKVGEYLED